ncbi:MAG TPA: AarF/UbiB family protein, partial [Rhizomicrobium sp.]|nr:AarF/UbiB family protein [Rhizomicrobium sp.]
MNLFSSLGLLQTGYRVRKGRLPPTRLALALERNGPAAIKLGQMLATRPDIVGEDVARALEHLQDRLPPFPESEARRVIAREFAKPVEALFASFGGAIAAASIAQVHKAVTLEGVAVAVKVLRPGIETEFARDLSGFAFFAGLAENFFAEARRLRLVALVETLKASVALELDLRMEAAAASELYDRTSGDTEFRVPHVDWGRTSARVLTSEWIECVSLRDTDA